MNKMINFMFFAFIFMLTNGTIMSKDYDDESMEGRKEIVDEGSEYFDIDSEPVGDFFDFLDYDDGFFFPRRRFSINFLNHGFNYTVLAPMDGGGCTPETKLFVFVPTRPDSFYLRQKIRESWAANLTEMNIVLKFVVGWPSNDNDIFDLLLEEFSQLDDLILYDIEDTYANLYFKVYVALQWQREYCPDVQFLLKTDDDTVVDLDRLQWWIDNDFSQRTAQHPSAVFGGLWRGVRAIRSPEHKWYVPHHLYAKSKYPAYMNGPTYLLSNRAVSSILNATEGVKAFSIEDILYTGILANRAHVHKFSVWQHFRQGKYIYVHERCRMDNSDRRLVPFVTAIYGISNPAKLQNAFDQLRSVNCSPWSSMRRLLWSSFFSSD